MLRDSQKKHLKQSKFFFFLAFVSVTKVLCLPNIKYLIVYLLSSISSIADNKLPNNAQTRGKDDCRLSAPKHGSSLPLSTLQYELIAFLPFTTVA